MRSILFAAAGTLGFALLLGGIPEDADARGYGKSAHARGHMMMAPRGVRRARVAGRQARVAPKVPGGCGTYMYWKGGRCMDARNKK